MALRNFTGYHLHLHSLYVQVYTYIYIYREPAELGSASRDNEYRAIPRPDNGLLQPGFPSRQVRPSSKRKDDNRTSGLDERFTLPGHPVETSVYVSRLF